MNRRFLLLRNALPLLVPALLVGCLERANGQEGMPPCLAAGDHFLDEVWAKVGEQTCLKCHHQEGDASESHFLLTDPSSVSAADRPKIHAQNQAAFARMARADAEGQSRMLQKVVGDLEHGGGQVLDTDSTGYQILACFVARSRGEAVVADAVESADSYVPPDFFAGIEMIEPVRLLRRVTLSLAGRLPSESERATVAQNGLAAFEPILDAIMQEEAFYDRLAEAFNDILLLRGYDGVPERVLGYRNFGNTRNWYQKWDFSHIEDEKERREAGYRLAREYREAILNEPYELIKYIVRNERPFTEIVTADYIMVSPYTARGYGVFDEVKDRFEDREDYLEYIPVTLKALTTRDGRPDQESPTGFYPHSGLLSTFHWLKRYPTTETNRNRLRARMFYQHFLGVDIMTLAPRVTDAAAVDAAYEIPTMQAADCVVCHTKIDPVAGIFQDYYDTSADQNTGPYNPRKEGWYTDMFGPGFEGEDLPEDEGWRAVQWLGERTASDPRFARAMVGHVYYILTGREPLLPPDAIDDPLFPSRRRAYQVQQEEINEIAKRFVERDFNLKEVFKAWIVSPFYRADGMTAAADHPRRQAELEDLGVVRMLTPEQLDRKIRAVFGKPWDRFGEQMQMLYGGIDSKEVTERISDPSGAMGAIQRIMANTVACENVAADFALPPEDRRLFPEIEPDVLPGNSSEDDERIRNAIVHLHEHILGRNDSPDDPEVERTFRLFADIVDEANQVEGIEATESYFCKSAAEEGPRDPDPNYTIRAWRGVVTYLLRQEEFLYE